MSELITSPLFPVEGLSEETLVKLPPRPIAQSGSIKLYIIFAEPHLFLEGFSDQEAMERPPAVLRGCLFVRVLKPVKIKSITLKLKGVMRTDWPEGIPPDKSEHTETSTIMSHTWPFFYYANTYPVSDHSRNNADLFVAKGGGVPDLDEIGILSLDSNLSSSSSRSSFEDMAAIKSHNSIVKMALGAGELGTRSKANSLLSPHSGSGGSNPDDNKVFVPGDYIYSFEQLFASTLPESINLTFGSTRYFMEASLERSGAFKTNLHARRTINIVRTPGAESSEENEPIVIDRCWEDQLHYEIVISSKQVILCSYLQISFKLTPLEKIKVHRIRIYVTEHLEYFCRKKRVHRSEPAKKVLLAEHNTTKEHDNLLAMDGDEISGIHMNFQVFVPQYYGDRFQLHPDTYCENVQSHHWIKICVRLSKLEPTPDNPQKRKHYELSIDSPIHILSQHCAHANTLLPSYQDQIEEDTGLIGEPQNLKDANMEPRSDMIVDSNLYQPDFSTPIELMSPQAKPFSPQVSPGLNMINPGLRPVTSTKPIELLRRLSVVSPPPMPVTAVPPPPFEEVDKNPPPTYEEAVKRTSTPSTYEEIGDRSSHRDESTLDLGDMDGNFRLKVMPIRSRSPSPPVSPVTRPYMYTRSPIIRGLSQDSSSILGSSNAIDAALAGTDSSGASRGGSMSPLDGKIEQQQDQQDLPEEPDLYDLEDPIATPVSPIPVPQARNASIVSSASRNSSIAPSLGSVDPALKKPLLGSSAGDAIYNDAALSYSNLSLRNGSVTTNLNFARNPENSIDITTMFGTAVPRPETPIHAIGMDDIGTQPSGAWRPYSTTHAAKPESEEPTSPKATDVQYGVGPVLATLQTKNQASASS